MSRGCMVLTRPSSISGKPVTSSTSVTGMPESLRSRAVPPVEMTVTPMSVRALANDSTPLLLKTEISARLTFTMLLLRMTYPWRRGGLPRRITRLAQAYKKGRARGMAKCARPAMDGGAHEHDSLVAVGQANRAAASSCSASTAPWTQQPAAWSLTMPAACMSE